MYKNFYPKKPHRLRIKTLLPPFPLIKSSQTKIFVQENMQHFQHLLDMTVCAAKHNVIFRFVFAKLDATLINTVPCPGIILT